MHAFWFPEKPSFIYCRTHLCPHPNAAASESRPIRVLINLEAASYESRQKLPTQITFFLPTEKIVTNRKTFIPICIFGTTLVFISVWMLKIRTSARKHAFSLINRHICLVKVDFESFELSTKLVSVKVII